ncbi:Hypothetical protein PHPALM_160 [Phytophthora palmivora]|uniref:Uncharacterized protein n=1 Tax=Phytophthora palmivora TaxID=4796 RepID=A0A2P4YVJ4_9STRA|nr:Hypothetical protein PHPALM_160 [Phytophthora palmivora]
MRVERCRQTATQKMGPPPFMTERGRSYLIRAAYTDNSSAPQPKTIQRVLATIAWLCYTKVNSTLPLSKADKIQRKVWASKMLMHPEGNDA